MVNGKYPFYENSVPELKKKKRIDTCILKWIYKNLLSTTKGENI